MVTELQSRQQFHCCAPLMDGRMQTSARFFLPYYVALAPPTIIRWWGIREADTALQDDDPHLMLRAPVMMAPWPPRLPS
eukprot:gene2074-2351_t